MVEKNDLVQIINDLFFPLGFKRKGNNWIYKGEILSKTINLQKSNFSNQYYLNYGFIINNLELTNLYDHIGHRLGASNEADNIRLRNLLNIESDINLSERSVELKKLINEKIVSLFRTINDESEFLEHIKMLPYSSMIPVIVKNRYGLSEW